MSIHTQHVIYFILYLLAALCFLAATVNVARPKVRDGSKSFPFNLIALGLLFWIIPMICVDAQLL